MKNTPPHKLLLIRFFSQGLLSAAIVILIAGIILTRLEQKNYLRHATISAQERIERIASHIGHQIEDVSLSHAIDSAEIEGQTPMQILVIQEAKNSGLRKLQVLDENGVVLGSSASQEIGINLTSSEITHVQTTGEVTGHFIENNGDPYLHFAAPVEAHGKKYVVVIEEFLSEMQTASRDIQVTVAVTLAIGFLFVFLVLGIIVRRAGLDIETYQEEGSRVKDLLGRYVSHQVAAQILEHGGLRVGGERRFITVLFSDIRGFTALSENLTPEKVVEMLNEYLATFTEIVFKYDGTVDKFLGDGIMALFGAPVGHDDDIIRAVYCARDMQHAFDILRQKWLSQGLPDLGLGIGINTGDAVVGNVGSARRLDYTAIGDTVNTAQRLQSVAETGQVIIGEGVYARLDPRAACSLGLKYLKGKSEPQEVFCLVLHELSAPTLD